MQLATAKFSSLAVNVSVSFVFAVMFPRIGNHGFSVRYQSSPDDSLAPSPESYSMITSYIPLRYGAAGQSTPIQYGGGVPPPGRSTPLPKHPPSGGALRRRAVAATVGGPP